MDEKARTDVLRFKLLIDDIEEVLDHDGPIGMADEEDLLLSSSRIRSQNERSSVVYEVGPGNRVDVRSHPPIVTPSEQRRIVHETFRPQRIEQRLIERRTVRMAVVLQLHVDAWFVGEAVAHGVIIEGQEVGHASGIESVHHRVTLVVKLVLSAARTVGEEGLTCNGHLEYGQAISGEEDDRMQRCGLKEEEWAEGEDGEKNEENVPARHDVDDVGKTKIIFLCWLFLPHIEPFINIS